MTLPGMPPRIGDPGVFLCSRADIEPWTVQDRPRRLRSVPAAPPPTPGVWLVRALCPACSRRAGYCDEHYPGNWWLTVWGR